MTDIGHAALLLALVFSVYTVVVAILAGMRRQADLLESARRATLVTFALVSLALGLLAALLLSRDYQVRYVYQHVSSSLRPIYALVALWAGQEGSLLLWLWLVGLLGAVMVITARRAPWSRGLEPYALAVMGLMTGFLALLLGFVARPFDLLPARALDGLGLNPQLQNPGMIYHPPLLFLGYAAHTVPLAYAAAALASGQVSRDWVRGVRRWSLFAWGALGLGILAGARWAYVELGWGGYWAWDPVENASLIPWLTGTALLHSLIIQERRGLFKGWNQALIALSFMLCLFATVITRSGLVQSVHAYGGSTTGYAFLGFLLLVGAVMAVLILTRRELLRSEGMLEAVLSREGAFLLTNLLFCGLAGAVFLGTVFPALTGALTGVPIALGRPFFDRVSRPLALALLLLLGVCPLLGWRRSNRLQASLAVPLGVAVAAVTVGVLLLGLHWQQGIGLLALGLVALAAATMVQEMVRGTLARRHVLGERLWLAPLNLVRKGRQRYGGYLVHLSVLLMALAITGEGLYKVDRQALLRLNESAVVGPYTVRLEAVSSDVAQDRERLVATLGVYLGETRIGTLRPEYSYYRNPQQYVSEVAIRSTLREDLYVAVVGTSEDRGAVTLHLLVNPLMLWLWIGGALMLVGVALAMWPTAPASLRAAAAEPRRVAT